MVERVSCYCYELWLSEVATTDHKTTIDADTDGGGLRAVASCRVRRRRRSERKNRSRGGAGRRRRARSTINKTAAAMLARAERMRL